ncbi:MAG: hypothetical protein LC624_04900 [Halobacteriales archaeon]|nr:hypothetical protein [Halobacteriales archaeon]
MRALIAGGTVLVLLLTAVPVAVPAAPGSHTLLDDVTAKMMELSGGSMQGSATLYIWQPDGSAIARPMSTQDFLDTTHYLSNELLAGVDVEAADPTSGGVGVGVQVNSPNPTYPYLPTSIPTLGAMVWPFCDAATTYVYYAGSPPVGAAFQQRTGTGQVSPNGPVCPGLGAPFGDALIWQDVTIDSRLLPSDATIVRQVGVAQVMAPNHDVATGVAGGYLLGHPVGSAHGAGSAVSMVWTSAFGTLSADMFRGNGDVLLIGNGELGA